jgi:hypothetical protein
MIMNDLGGAGRAYGRKRAAKRGLTIEELIKEKHADELASEIDRMFGTCQEIEGIVDLYPDGLFCKYPERWAKLELQKARQHNRMMELARERFRLNQDTSRSPSSTAKALGKPVP